MDFRHPLAVIYKRRWLATSSFMVVAVGLAVRSLTEVPIYEARTRLLLDPERLNVVAFQDVVTQGVPDYPTQYGILRSRSLARRTLESLNLLKPAPPDPRGGDAPPVSMPGPQSRQDRNTSSGFWSRAVAAAGSVLGKTPAGTETRAEGETAAEARAVDGFLAGLTVAPVPLSRLLDLKYRSGDPVTAARFVNAHARQFIEQSLELRFQSSKEATDWLNARLAEQRKKVEASEQALLVFRERHGVILPGSGESVLLQKLTDVAGVATKATAARIEKEAQLKQFQAIQKDPVLLEASPTLVSNPLVQDLKSELNGMLRTEAQLAQTLLGQHPRLREIRQSIQEIRSRLQAEIEKVGQTLEAEFLAAQATETRLVEVFEAQKRDALAMDRRSIELAVLEREAAANNSIYTTLTQRLRETGIASELRTTSARVIDAAEVPATPVWPERRRDLRRALLFGVLVALALVFSFEYLDNRIKSPDEIRALGLPLLGMVPAVPAKKGRGDPLINNGASAGFTEAFRTFRTNVVFSSAAEGARSVLIASAGPSEGKSVVASNLATALAQAGGRVLLIDGDMRRPRLHEHFGQACEPGLSNLMVGSAKASDVVRTTGTPGVWFLPAGVLPPNPSELLGSPRFNRFLGQLTDVFEWVIVDSPPVMAVTDATVIAHTVTGVVLVVGAEMTSRYVVMEAMERLEAVGAHIMGAVLSRVDLERNRYYYRSFYRREYTEYYTSAPRS